MLHSCFLCSIRMAYKIFELPPLMGLFNRKKTNTENDTKCKECGTELHDPDRLKKHMKKAHGNVPAKKLDPTSGDGGTW